MKKQTKKNDDARSAEVRDASRKRGPPSASDGSGWKRAKCEHRDGRQNLKGTCKYCGGSTSHLA
jgi:hypothetical protein